jgi:hypothetical protein
MNQNSGQCGAQCLLKPRNQTDFSKKSREIKRKEKESQLKEMQSIA